MTTTDAKVRKLMDEYEKQPRTLQRRVKQCRAQQSPDREVFFAQCHRPGKALHPDCTKVLDTRKLVSIESDGR